MKNTRRSKCWTVSAKKLPVVNEFSPAYRGSTNRKPTYLYGRATSFVVRSAVNDLSTNHDLTGNRLDFIIIFL